MNPNPSSEQRSPKARRRLPWRKRILFAGMTALMVLLMFEITLQLYYRITAGQWLWQWWAVPIFESDPVRVYRVKSNLDYIHKTKEFSARYRTDNIGLRNDGRTPTPSIPKSNDVFRILSLGPSFAFGWGVDYEDSYAYQIANGLRVPGKRVELINLGTPAQPMNYQLKWLREIGYQYQPDLILQTVYASLEGIATDDHLPPDKPVVRNGYLAYPGEGWLDYCLKRARLYSAVFFYGWHVYHSIATPSREPSGDGREFYAKDGTNAVPVDECLARFRSYLNFVQLAATNQPAVSFLHVPIAYVVRPSDIGRFRYASDPQQARQQTAEVVRILETNHVSVIDPSRMLIGRDKETRMYNLYDIHLTKAGNKAVSEYAIPILQDLVNRRENHGGPP